MRPFYPFVGNLNQFESTGRSSSKNLGLRIQSANVKYHQFGFNGMLQYTLGSSRDNLSAVNQYNWNADWGYSNFDARHRVFSFMTITLPKSTNLGFFINGQSGNPYTVTTGRDNNGDQSTNDRPAGYARNSERSPGRYNVDLNFTKTFTLTHKEAGRPGVGATGASGAPQVQIRQFAEPQVIMMPGGGGPVMMPMPGGPGAPGAPGLRMSFNVSAQNVLNNTQLRGYSGVQTSPFFRQSNTAMDGRRIRLGLNFLF